MERNNIGADNMPYDDIKILIDITNKKLVHLNSFLNITLKQRETIEKDDMEELDRCISEKESHIEIIDKLDVLFGDKFNKIKVTNNIQSLNEIDDNAHPYIKQLKENMTQINDILRKIQIVDKQNTDTLNQKFDEVKSKLRQVKQGQKMNKGYNTAAYGTMFIDQKN